MALTQVQPGLLDSNSTSLSFKNKIINGNFSVAQRSTLYTGQINQGSTNYYSLDRWFTLLGSTFGNYNFGQTTPQTSGVYKAGYFGRQSGETSAPTSVLMGQQIESFNVWDLRGQTCTLSFNAFKGATAPSTLSVGAKFGTGTDQASVGAFSGTLWTGITTSTTTISVGTTVAPYTYSFTVPSNANEMVVYFSYAPTGTAGASEWFALENVQVEKGSATSFEYRPITIENTLCYRYFYKTFPGTSYTQGPIVNPILGNASRVPVPLVPVPMRTQPNMVFYDQAGNSGLTEFGSGTNRSITGTAGLANNPIGGGYVDIIAVITNAVYFAATYSAEL